MKARALLALPMALLALGAGVAAQAKDIVITHVATKSGPAGPYGTEALQGFMMGLEYLTEGTMTVAGNRIVVIQKDDQGNPNTAKALVAAAYADDKADIVVGPTLSASALAALPVAEEAKKIILIDAATADTITGAAWHRYMFRTARNNSHDQITAALTFPKDQDASLAILTSDAQYGRDLAKALKENLAIFRPRVKVVHEEFAAQSTTDFTAAIQRSFDALKDKPGRRVIYPFWAASASDPVAKIAAMQPERYQIDIMPPGHLHYMMQTWKGFPGLEGQIYYQYTFPKNKLNDWLVAEYRKRHGRPPDFFVPGGMIAAAAIVQALRNTQGDASAEALIKAMEGMSFDSPKGRMVIRKEDHQALQEMYIWRMKRDTKDTYDFLDLVRTVPIDEMPIPIVNKR